MLTSSIMGFQALLADHAMLPVLLLKATVILFAALGVTLLMQRASAGARHLVWLVTLSTLLLMPALSAWGPVRIAVLPASTGALSLNAAPAEATPAASGRQSVAMPSRLGADDRANLPIVRTEAAAHELSAAERVSASARSSLASLSITDGLLSVWAIVALFIAASLAWSAFAVKRIVVRARPLDGHDWLDPFYEVSDRLGLDAAPRLLVSLDTRMPFACGLLAPTIVLPADCDTWSLDRRRAVLLHELAHVKRHDLIGHSLGRLVCALYWFHPLAWTAAKHLRNESERACDDLALSCGTRATDYAEHLLDIVTSVRHDSTPALAMAMARRKEFEGRMLAILDPEIRRSSLSRRQSASLIGTLALIALTVGAIAPTARPADAAVLTTAPQSYVISSVTSGRSGTNAPIAARVSGPLALPMVQLAPRADTIEQGSSDTATSASWARREARKISKSSERETRDATRELTREVTREVTRDATNEAIRVSVNTNGMTSQLERAASSFGVAVGELAAGTTVTVIEGLLGGASKTASASGADDRPALLSKVLRSDTSAAVRKIAAWGLREYVRGPIAVEALSGALKRDADATVREMAAWSLASGEDGNSLTTDALGAALRSDANERVRGTAAWSLGHVGGRSSTSVLAAALGDGGPEVRARAAWALGHIEPKQAPPALVELLRDRDIRTRRIASWALYRIQDPSTAPALEAALKVETDKDVQLGEISALASLGEKSVDALRSLIESPDARVRTMAVRALAGGHATGPWPWPWPEPRPYP